MFLFALCLLIAIVFCAAWYWLAVRHNRRRALQVLRWLEGAVAGQGQVTGIRWIARSQFKVPLRLRHSVFNRAWVLVDLSPCELPLRWLMSKARGRREILTFQADLDLPPAFTLQVHNFRWFAHSGKNTASSRTAWGFEHTGPFVISTRRDWQKQIPSAMVSLAKGEHRDFLKIDFQRRSPHFSVTLPLETIAPGSPTRACMFDSMRELASSSSASLS
jgi:hypothetical protein